jgi:hypothetical protein
MLMVSGHEFPQLRLDVREPAFPEAGFGISRVLGSADSSRHTANPNPVRWSMSLPYRIASREARKWANRLFASGVYYRLANYAKNSSVSGWGFFTLCVITGNSNAVIRHSNAVIRLWRISIFAHWICAMPGRPDNPHPPR